MIDINDPKLWRKFNWDEWDDELSVPIKSQGKVNKARANRLKALDPIWKEKQKLGAQKKRQDPEFAKKIAAAARDPSKIKSMVEKNQKAVVTPFGDFESQLIFDKQGFIKARFIDRRRLLGHLYYYKDEGPSEPTYENVVYSPYGIFREKGNSHNPGATSTIFRIAQESKDEFALQYKDIGTWWKRVREKWPEKYYIKTEIAREWLKEK